MDSSQLLMLAAELQSLAQAGLYYTKDIYDKERFERIREISAEIAAAKTELPLDTVKNYFCSDFGYQTPKIDTRAAVVKDNKILLVCEKNGEWALPGGWCEFNMSPVDNAIKESKEEAGRNVKVKDIIAVQTRGKHTDSQMYPFEIVRIFYLCEELDGDFTENSETVDAKYFCENELPNLAEEKNTVEQIKMCLEAYRTEKITVKFD